MKSAEEIRDENKCVPFPHMAFLSVEVIRTIQADALRHAVELLKADYIGRYRLLGPTILITQAIAAIEAEADKLTKP